MSSVSAADRQIVRYDDVESETFDFAYSRWPFLSATLSSGEQQGSLASELQVVLFDMLWFFGNKQFMRHQSQGFPLHATANAYDSENISFKRTISVVFIHEMP